MKTVFGIDLGTTNTCIAKYNHHQLSVLDIDGSLTIPSVVAVQGDQILVGQEALNISKMAPDSAIRSVKRIMGAPQTKIKLEAREFSPVEISGRILLHLKEKVRDLHHLQVEDVVITVPAYFNDLERRGTMQAGQLAGLNVLGIINEPTAASLVYNPPLEKDQEPEEEKWIIYDLGGGTFDVTVLSVKGPVKEVLSSCGNVHLGGDDFDFRIRDFLVEMLRKKEGADVTSDKLIMTTLRSLSERIKIQISTQAEVAVKEILPWKDRYLPLDFTFNRELLEFLIGDFIDGTLEKTKEALYQANTRSGEIQKLILVGGSSRIPLVRQKLEKELGLSPFDYVDPDLSVAMGAAIYAAMNSGLHFERVMIDVAPFSLGIACLGDEDYYFKAAGTGENRNEEEEDGPETLVRHLCQNHGKTFAPIIKANSKLPARFEEVFYTATDNQTEVEIPLYQGNSSRVAENFFIGSFIVPLHPSPEGTPVKISLAYNLNGMVEISVAQNGMKKSHSFNMDLNQTAEMNLDTSVIGLLNSYGEDVDLDWQEEEGEGFSMLNTALPVPENVANLLIKKVEEKIASSRNHNPDETHSIEKKLLEYRQILVVSLTRRPQQATLSEEQEQKLDELEDHLQDWLDRGERKEEKEDREEYDQQSFF